MLRPASAGDVQVVQLANRLSTDLLRTHARSVCYREAHTRPRIGTTLYEPLGWRTENSPVATGCP